MTFLTICSFGQGLIITPGVGVKGLIEIGKTVKENEKTIGKGKRKKEKINHECIKNLPLEYSIVYDNYGIIAFINRYDRRKKQEKRINWITFDKDFNGNLDNGIIIGKTTREQVYEIYGSQEHNNPSIEYSALGIGFLFDNSNVQGNDNDLLIEIEVFEPKKN